MSSNSLIDLRASAAMRREDLRIATKHREEAAARKMSPANRAAYERALAWEQNRREAAEAAGAALIRANDVELVRERIGEAIAARMREGATYDEATAEAFAYCNERWPTVVAALAAEARS